MPPTLRWWKVAVVAALAVGVGLLAYEAAVTLQPQPSETCGPPASPVAMSAQAICTFLALGASTNTTFPGGMLYNFTIESASPTLKFTDVGIEVRTPAGADTPFDSVCFEAQNGSAVATYTASGWAASGTTPRCSPTAVYAPGDATFRNSAFILVYMPGPSSSDSLTFLGLSGWSGTTSGTFE